MKLSLKLKTEKSRTRKRGGFTLIEMLISVAIIAVLAAISITSIPTLRTTLKMRQLDSTAKIIFVAAQNRLTELRASGQLSTVGGIQITQMPVDYDTTLWDWDTNSEYYFYLMKGTASEVLADTVIDDYTAAGYYIIEFNIKTASVYGVFFSEDPILYQDDIATMESRAYDARRENNILIGYYGGSVADVAEFTQALSPEISLLNGEELRLDITADAGYTYTVSISSETSAYPVEYVLNGIASADVINNENVSATGSGYTIILDSLEDGLHFSQHFGLASGFTPGQDITIEVTSEASGKLPTTVSATTNSLFARRMGGEADISCARHLQNLAPDVSGLPESGEYAVTTATQTAVIDWAGAIGTSVFHPITNSSLTTYDGSGNVIGNLNVQPISGASAAGLFGDFGGAASNNLTNIRLVNISVTGGSAIHVGALAGYTHNTTVSGCRVYANPASLADIEDCGIISNVSGSGALCVGGLIGRASGGSVSGSFASLPLISVSASSSSSPYVGGLFGKCSAVVSSCYANTASLTVNSSASTAMVGGFAGYMHSDVSDCYSLGTITSQNKVNAGGFACVLENTTNTYENIYSAAVFDGSGSGISVKGFAFDSGYSASLSNCLCLKGTGFTDTGSDSVIASTGAQINDAFKSANWVTAAEASTVPYTITGAYPLPRLAPLYHYGDWPEITSSTLGPVQLAYFEIYMMSNATYTIGFYNDFADVDDNSVVLNTLLNDGQYASIVQDGYVVLFEKDGGSASTSGVPYNLLAYGWDCDFYSDGTKYSYQTWALNGNTVKMNELRYPSRLTYNSSNISVKYQGVTLSDGSTISFNDTDYYPLFLTRDQVVIDDTTSAGYYQPITISLNAAGTRDIGATAYTFYYNPHFAKSKISTEPINDSQITVSIRTERQFATLATSLYSKYWASNISYVQERDLNYSTNPYTTSYLDKGYDWNPYNEYRSVTDPIGNGTTSFRGRYDGGNHTITGTDIHMDQNSAYAGMFGATSGAEIKNIRLVNPGINVNRGTYTQSGVSYAGALVGYANATSITNIAITNVNVYANNCVGAVAGVVSGASRVDNISVSGGLVRGVRLVGTFGQLLGNASGASVAVSNVNINGLNVTTILNESTGLNSGTINGGSFGTAVFAGNISLGAANALCAVSDVTMSGCTVNANIINYYNNQDIEVAGLFVGSVYCTNTTAALNFGSNLTIGNSVLYANASRTSDAFGGVIGKVSSSANWSLTAPSVTLTTSTINRATSPNSYSSSTGTGVGGYIGSAERTSGTLTIDLPATIDLSGLSYIWNNTSYVCNIGGIFGKIGSGVVIDSVNGASGSIMRLSGVNTALRGDGRAVGGFVGYSSGKISNISVANVSIYSDFQSSPSSAYPYSYISLYAGGFAGIIDGGIIEKCDVRLENGFYSAHINVYGNAGGFAGEIINGAAVSHCFAAVDVNGLMNYTYNTTWYTGPYYGGRTGGFVGVLNNSSVSSCYASGNVSGNYYVGGFAGYMEMTPTPYTVQRCYATGDVAGSTSPANVTAHVGGFVGEYNGGVLRDSYSLGSVTKTNIVSGGLGGFVGNIVTSSASNITNDAYMYYPGTNAYNYSYSDYVNTKGAGIIRWTMVSFYNEALHPTKFTAMSAAIASYPYDSGFDNFLYPALSGVGAGISAAVHWGDWPEITIPPVPPVTDGTYTMGVFRYEQISGTIYRIDAAAVNYNYYWNANIINVVSINDFYTVEIDLAEYLKTNTLSSTSVGYGVLWDKRIPDYDQYGFRINNTFISNVTLGADLNFSSEYYFRPVSNLTSVTEFEIYHDNGHSGKNLDAKYTWSSNSLTFTVTAKAR